MSEIGARERLYLWLHYASGASPRMFAAVEVRYPDLNEAFELAKKRSDTAFAFLNSEPAVARLMQAAEQPFMDKFVSWLERHHIDVCTLGSETYPKLLAEIHDPPRVLFVRGHIEPDPALPVAMVGSRKSTSYGRDIAQLFGRGLAESGAVVVSGMASGIDAASAQGALECKESPYPTVAVLGSGIDVIYPEENAKLYAQICERGAVVTEFLPKTEPKRENFPVRNRIMSGLSRGVVVVEAGERSGTSITAGYAHDEGREVFAVPGRITDAQSVGTNRMIQRGEAKPIFCVADILQEFESASVYDTFQNGPEKVKLSSLSADEQAIARALLQGEKSFDELAEQTGLPAGKLNSGLTALQFSGIMKQLPGRVYALDTVQTALTED